jgi:adenine-specific DNA methylase
VRREYPGPRAVNAEQQPAGGGIERRYLEGFVARRASREKQIQQHFRPVISVHKWFARRPGSLFRALALAEFVDASPRSSFERGHQLEGVCLDPFMGGGTPVVEAARAGMSVIGFDTNPMARWIVERELEDVDPDELARVGEQIATDVEANVADLYTTSCVSCGGEAAVRYFIWVRQHVCQDCDREHTLLADTEIVSTKLGRHPHELHLCPHCHALSERKPGKQAKRCGACRCSYASGLIPSDTLLACACGSLFRIPPLGTIEEPRLKLVAIEYHCSTCATSKMARRRAYKQPDARDLKRLARAGKLTAKIESRFWPEELIPIGVETARLMRWGYNRWRELFNDRQLYGLALLAERIDQEPESAVKRALVTVFSDLLRYQNMLCRYDRQALKPTDVFAVHGFPVPRVACEATLLGERGIGSGGFRHGLEKYVRAKRWCRAPYEKTIAGKNIATSPERIASEFVDSAELLPERGGAYLKRGSLALDELAEASVDLVLTDPPYFANLQYGELMDFCYVWLRRLAPKTPYFTATTTKTADDAIGSGGEDAVDIVEFSNRLSTVFQAATRALKPGAAFCFTYHHNELEAYAPLVVACVDAGLVPTGIYACPSEMRSSTHIHQRNASTVDTLFVLRKPPAVGEVDIAQPVNKQVQKHLATLRRIGQRPTEADRDCLRSGQLAVRAMHELAADWQPQLDPAERFARASETLRALADLPLEASAAAI